MGEFLVIRAGLLSAAEMLKVLGDPRQLYWEEGPHHLDVLARWLPEKGFKILPKFFDPDYRPGKVGDEGDNLIRRVRGCYLKIEGDGQEVTVPVWRSTVLELPQTRDELRRILEGNVLDMSFEEEVVKELEGIFGDAGYEADEQALEDDNENLRDFARIMMQLADCIDKAKQRGELPYLEFEFYIPRG